MGRNQRLTATVHTVDYKGQPLEVVATENAYANEHGLDVDGKCFVCGFKPRKGAHTYWVHVSNTQFLGKNLILLPFDADANDSGLSLGWWEIGSECRKLLPEKFVQKRKKEEA